MDDSIGFDLLQQLQGQPAQQIGQQLGLSQSQATGAVSAALPLLLGALGRNASQPQGAQALFGALQRDHAGLDIGSVLGSVLGGGQNVAGSDGNGILGHVFGDRQPRAEQALGQATGLGNDNAGQLMKMLAPVVMAFVAKRLSASSVPTSPEGLGELLGQEQHHVEQQGAGGLLGAVLDRDNDGDTDFSDLAGLAGTLFGGRR